MDEDKVFEAVRRILHAIDVAEKEIRRAKARRPDKADVLDDAFPLLRPTPPLRGKPDRLYRSHCAELLDRVAAGEDTRPPTDAEVVGFLSDLSLEAPLRREAIAVCARAFRRVFPERAGAEEDLDAHTALVDEEERRLRRQLTAQWRAMRR